MPPFNIERHKCDVGGGLWRLRGHKGFVLLGAVEQLGTELTSTLFLLHIVEASACSTSLPLQSEGYSELCTAVRLLSQDSSAALICSRGFLSFTYQIGIIELCKFVLARKLLLSNSLDRQITSLIPFGISAMEIDNSNLT